MYAALKLEAIGDGTGQLTKLAGDVFRSIGASDVADLYKSSRPRPWVARITGLDAKYGLKREFVRGRKDYRDATSNGNRGVMMHYLLEPGIYEVQELLSWSKIDRYFARSQDGALTRMTRQEVEQCLRLD